MRCATCGNEALPGQQFCALHQGSGGVGPQTISDIYSTFWARAGAAIIDCILLIIVGAIVGLATPNDMQIRLSASVVVAILYYVLFESSALQATPGKLAVQAKITDLNGERISPLRALGRYLGRIV